MRPLLAAFAACVLAAAPAELLAQQPVQAPVPPPAPQRPIVKPIPGVRPRPVPTHAFNHRPNQQFPIGVYPTIVVNPTPTAAPKRKATPRPNNHGQDVFETHSSDDAK